MCRYFWIAFSLFSYICVSSIQVLSVNLPIKVVKQPANLLIRPAFQHSNPFSSTVKEANFSGPEHLRILSEMCITEIYHGYEYNVCLFHNITQRETESGLSGYAGVLGVWRGWQVKNDSLSDMIYTHGDLCNGRGRQATVHLECPSNLTGDLPILRLDAVVEAPTCMYRVTLLSPLVCPQDAMLLYPLLTASAREQWQQWLLLKARKTMSETEYERHMQRLLKENGLFAEDEDDAEEAPFASARHQDVNSQRNHDMWMRRQQLGGPNQPLQHQSAGQNMCDALLQEKEAMIQRLQNEIRQLRSNSTSAPIN